jgi:multicomponent Na+:H+ antiporter subunit G
MIYIGHTFMIIGALFCFLGGLGILRMPDVYNRIQAGTKAVTLGSLSVFIGVGFLQPEWWPKLVAISGFILLTSPVGSSAIARAFIKSGIKPWQKSGDGSSQND